MACIKFLHTFKWLNVIKIAIKDLGEVSVLEILNNSECLKFVVACKMIMILEVVVLVLIAYFKVDGTFVLRGTFLNDGR